MCVFFPPEPSVLVRLENSFAFPHLNLCSVVRPGWCAFASFSVRLSASCRTFGATTYITTAVPYWLATGCRPLSSALQKPHNIRGGSSRTDTQTCCASPDSHKMRAGRMGACVCVCV